MVQAQDGRGGGRVRIAELLHEVQYGQRISIEFKIGIVTGTVQTLVKVLDVKAITAEIKCITAENNEIKVVVEE